MTKQNYLNELYSRLSFLPEQERREIMADYEEHFAAGNEKGKTEQQICEELGTPESIAGQYSGYRGESAPYSYNAPQKNTRSKASRSVYLVLMVLDIIFLAIPGYPAAAGLIIAAFAVIALSVAHAAFLQARRCWAAFWFPPRLPACLQDY